MKKAILFLLSFAILAGIIIYIKPTVLLSTMAGANPYYILLAFILSNTALFFRVMKWKYLVNGVTFREIAPVQFFGIAASNLTPGKLGEPVKSIALKMLKGIPVSTTISTVIWERIIDVIVMMLFGFAGFYVLAANQYIGLFIMASLLFVAVIAFLIAVMHSQRFGRKIFSIFHSLPLMNKISDQFLENFYKGAGIKPSGFVLCFLFTFGAWLSDGVVFYLAFLSITSTTMSFSFPLVIACILCMSILIGIVSSLPGGVGGTEAVMILMLSAVGIGTAVAGSVVLIGRALTFFYSILVGYFALLWLGRKIDTRKILKETGF